MMTKKDYILIADCFVKVLKPLPKMGGTPFNELKTLIDFEIELMTAFKMDNPKFDNEKFIAYIGNRL